MTGVVARRRGTLGFAIFTLVMIVTCLGLGIWQLQRRVEKHALIAALNERLAAAPEALPPPSQWSALTPAKDEFRRVSFTATYARLPDVMVYSSGSVGPQRRFRPRHLGVPAGANRRWRDRRGQYRLRAEHDAGSRAAGSRGRPARHRSSR